MKKTIIILGIIGIVVGIFFWLRYDLRQNAYLERVQEDLRTLERDNDNLRIDNRSLEREKKSMRDELEIYKYGNGKG